jgi:hypothetical protein
MLLLALASGSSLVADVHFEPWQKSQGGTEVSIRLEGNKNDTINVVIKNTSKVSEYYKGPDGFNSDVKIFFQKNGKDVPLRNYEWLGGSRTQLPEIKPNASISRVVTLSAEEKARLAGLPLFCKVGIFVIAGDDVKRYEIDSSPIVLITTVQ